MNRKRRSGLHQMIVVHMIAIFVIMVVTISFVTKDAGTDEADVNGESHIHIYDSEKVLQSGYALFAKEPSRQEIVQMQKSTESQVEPETENLTVESEKPEWALRITAQERYYLAKIAMCEAEGESAITKALVVMVVINRAESPDFPNTIWEVLSQKSDEVYQFSPLAPGGRWEGKEPDEGCYRVVDMLMSGEIEDTSDGALYFEACSETDNWHSRNLEYLYDSDNVRFYK